MDKWCGWCEQLDGWYDECVDQEFDYEECGVELDVCGRRLWRDGAEMGAMWGLDLYRANNLCSWFDLQIF